MVIDSSALLAIFLDEPERKVMSEAILSAPSRIVSAASALEAGIVIEARLGESAGRDFDLFLDRAEIKIASVDAEQARVARAAWRRFGKGRHPARLNLGDCFAYALARVRGDVLLAKGEDFPKTDIELFRVVKRRKDES